MPEFVLNIHCMKFAISLTTQLFLSVYAPRLNIGTHKDLLLPCNFLCEQFNFTAYGVE